MHYYLDFIDMTLNHMNKRLVIAVQVTTEQILAVLALWP